MRINLQTLIVCFIPVLYIAGCGSAEVEVKTGTEDDKPKKLGTVDDRGKCEVGEGEEEDEIDVNQDDVMDVRKVYKVVDNEQILLCREADLNYDGKKDIVSFYSMEGQLTRDEADLDYDGNFDIFTFFENGAIVRQELDTNGDGVIDRLRFVTAGQTYRIEGDANNDGMIDYWEYYDNGTLARVGYDLDADGNADRWDRNDAAEQEAPAEQEASADEEASAEEEAAAEGEDKEGE